MYSRLLVFLQFLIIGLMLWFGRGIVTSLVGLAVFSAGLFFGLWALAHNRLGNFNIRPDIKHGCEMVSSGPYRFVRHPMYTSVLLMMAGVFVSTPTLSEGLLFVLLFAVLTLKARREEHLWCGYHSGYTAYRSKTKMFIPFVW